MNFYNNTKEYITGSGLKEWPWLTFCFLIILPYALVTPIYQGLDASWNISLSIAIEEQFVFGKDYMFTYGPLGILSSKNILIWSKWVILSFEFFVVGSMVFIARFCLRETGYDKRCYLIVPFLFFLLKAGNVIHLITPVFIFFIFYTLKTKNKTALLVAIILSVIGFYIKVNYGLSLLLFFYLSMAYALFWKKLRLSMVLGAILIQALGILAFVYVLNVDLVGYVQSSLHLINSYNDAMYVYIELSHIHFILAVFILFLFFLGFALRIQFFLKHTQSLLLYFFCSLYLYLIFKNGFVRADAHRFEYFQQCAAPFALVYLWIGEEMKKKWAVLTCCVMVISYLALMNTDKIGMKVVKRMAEANYVKDIFTDLSYKKRFKPEEKFFDTIPSGYAREIGTGTVDIMPWDISEIYRWKLAYNPRPVIQSYSAYDEYLDGKNYEKYTSASAPDYLIYSSRTIDNRAPFWDESITKKAFLTHYELIDHQKSFEEKIPFDEASYLKGYPDVATAVKEGKLQGGYSHYLSSGRSEGRRTNSEEGSYYLLLKKRTKPLELAIVKETNIQIEMNKEFKVDTTATIQYLYAEVKYNLAGKLKRLLFQPPPLSVELTYSDGSKDSFKAITTILSTGVMLNRRINNTYEAGLFIRHRGKKNMAVTSIKFLAAHGFNPQIAATIREVVVREAGK